MKYVICIPDGCADEPTEMLGGKTPLEVASMPNLAALAARGEVGRAGVIPEGLPPGSDIGNMSILGYDPAEFHTGRAPIEAAALGIVMTPDEIAFRCNLVTVDDEGTMVDFAGGHPSDADAADAIAALDAELGSGVDSKLKFYPGVQYRHILVAPREWIDAECVPPHDLTGDLAIEPSGVGSEYLNKLHEQSREILARFGFSANQIWLWGQGPQPEMTDFKDKYGYKAGMVTAVDLVRGLGRLTNMDVVEVEGATGWYDTNYEGKRDAALDALESDTDVFIIHVEATDEAGHAGDANAKVTALENWDNRILAELVPAMNAMGPWRMLLLPDHGTPLDTKTHNSDPVPYLLFDSENDFAGGTYTEAGVKDAPLIPGHQLMSRLLDPV